MESKGKMSSWNKIWEIQTNNNQLISNTNLAKFYFYCTSKYYEHSYTLNNQRLKFIPNLNLSFLHFIIMRLNKIFFKLIFPSLSHSWLSKCHIFLFIYRKRPFPVTQWSRSRNPVLVSEIPCAVPWSSLPHL